MSQNVSFFEVVKPSQGRFVRGGQVASNCLHELALDGIDPPSGSGCSKEGDKVDKGKDKEKEKGIHLQGHATTPSMRDLLAAGLARIEEDPPSL